MRSGLAPRAMMLLAFAAVMAAQWCGPAPAWSQAPAAAANMAPALLRWSTVPGESVALVGPAGVIWQFNYTDKQGKPNFHPVALATGQALTESMPADHLWHYGLWFSWKYINGVNYWEEDKRTLRAPGLTAWSQPTIDTRPDGSATITMDLSYHLPDQPPVMIEKRTITIGAPRQDGSYEMDWTGAFTARAPQVVLDRTPLPPAPGGKKWGGYAGMSVRFAPQLTERLVTTDAGPVAFENDMARPVARAGDYSGVVAGHTCGIAMIDHPDNPRQPTTWYAINSSRMGYLNAALLTHEPLTLEADQTLTLRYRLMIHPGRFDAGRLAVEADRLSR